MGLGGSWNAEPVTAEDEKKAYDAVYAAIDEGIDTFDHADIYTFGKAETVFGRLLKADSSLRSKIKIQTKAGIQIGAGARGSSTYNFSKEYLLAQVQLSLSRLQTDYVDQFILHRPDPLADLAEVAEAFRVMEERGWVKSFGVSNMSVSQIDAMQLFLDVPIISNQIQFSLGHSLLINDGVRINTNAGLDSTLAGMLQFSQVNKLELQAWGSIDNGLYLQEGNSGKREVDETRQLVKTLAHKYNTSETSILLAWIFRIPAYISPVIGTTNPARIRESVQALHVDLSREDWYNLWLTSQEKPLP